MPPFAAKFTKGLCGCLDNGILKLFFPFVYVSPTFFRPARGAREASRASASKRRQIQPSRPSERHAEKRDAVNQVDFHPLCSFSHNIQQDVSLRKGDGRSERRRQGARPAAWHRSGIDESLFKVPRNAFQNSESATGDQRKLMRAAFSRRAAALASPAARPPRRRTVKSGRRLSTDSRGHAARSYLFLGSSLGADWNCSSSTQLGVPSGISLRLTLMSLPAKRGSSLA